MLTFIRNLFYKLRDLIITRKQTQQEEEIQKKSHALANYIIVVLLTKWTDNDLRLYRTELSMLTSTEYELKMKILNDYKYLLSDAEYAEILSRINLRFKI